MNKLKITPILLTLVLFTGITAFTEPEEWYSFTSAEEAYTIDFPKKPTPMNQTTPSDIGELEIKMQMVDASSEGSYDNMVYMSICTVYPDSTVHSSNTELLDKYFTQGIDGAVKNVKGKLLSEFKIEHQGYPGREFQISIKNDQAVITMQMFLIKNKAYMLQAISLKEKINNKSAKKFFKSFKAIVD